MVLDVGNILAAAQRAQLLASQKTARQLDGVSLHLATGQKVTSALDNPSSYFLARALRSRAGDLSRLLDGIGQNIRAIQEADNGVRVGLKLLDQADAYLQEVRKKYLAGELPDGGLASNETLVQFNSPADLTTYVAGQDVPATGPITTSGGDTLTLNGSRWQRRLVNYTITSQTVLVFDYRSTVQPEFASIGFDNDTNFVNDPNRYYIYGTQPSGITSVVPYLTYAYSGAGTFQEIEIPVGTHFTGTFTHLAIINDDDAAPYGNSTYRRIILREGPKQDSIDFTQSRNEYKKIVSQLDLLVKDAQYRGINLLQDDDMTTYFNPTNTSKLVSEGMNATYKGLGLNPDGIVTFAALEKEIDQVRLARNELRNFGRTLSNDLNIIQTRRILTEEQISINKAGADDLTRADDNEEGAKLLALQMRQQLQAIMLARPPANILTILT